MSFTKQKMNVFRKNDFFFYFLGNKKMPQKTKENEKDKIDEILEENPLFFT